MTTKPATELIVEGKPSNDPTVAVAFGGGGARGYAHIHIIEALDELGIRPVAISGASIGSIMGSAMASGMSGKEIREYAVNLAGNRADVVARYFRSRPGGISSIFSRDYSFGQLDAYNIMKTFLPEQVKSDFADLNIPMSISATDYYAYRETVYHSGDLFQAMAASSSIPAVFRPVKIDDRYMVDGGIYNPVPFDHLQGKADIIIGIDVVGTPRGDATKSPKAIDSIYGASQLMMQSILSHKLAIGAPDIFLRPKVSDFRVQDFFKAKQILAASEDVRDDLKRGLDRAFTAAVRGN